MPNLTRNRLLLALPSSNLKQLMPQLERIRCEREQVLMDADSSLDHLFFPDSGVVSAVAVYSDGRIIETATIGREGCTNVQAAIGAKRSSVRLLVQIPGSAQKMPRATFARAMETMPSFRNLMYAYLEAFLEQVLVSVACNGAHRLRERLARWLLMMRDRSDNDELEISQSLLAEVLGVPRPTDTHAGTHDRWLRECIPAGGAGRGDRRPRRYAKNRPIGDAGGCRAIVAASGAIRISLRAKEWRAPGGPCPRCALTQRAEIYSSG